MKQEQQNSGHNYEIYKVHLDNLYRMSQYCDNHTDCRRSQILEYFGEIFDRQKCIENKQTICDNCQAFQSKSFLLKDISGEAISIVKGVRELNGMDITLLHLAEILKGSMNAKIVEKQHNQLEMHGKLSRYKRTDIERIIRKLIFDSYLKEDVKILSHTDTVASYIKIGTKASILLNGNVKIEFDLRTCDSKESQNDDGGGGEDTQDGDDYDDGGGGGSSSGGGGGYSSTDTNSKSKTFKTTNKQKKTPMLTTNNAKFSNKISDLSAQNRILLRCRNDLKSLAKRICTEKCVKNINSIFTANMFKEMILNMPQTRDDLLRITHFTEALYLNYRGEDFLAVLKHYASQLEDLRLLEDLENVEKNNQTKQQQQQKKVTKLNVNEANTLLDSNLFDSDNDDSEWLMAKKSTETQSNNLKRNSQFNNSINKPNKKARVWPSTNNNNNNNSSYVANNDGDEEDCATSSYFNNSQNTNKSSNFNKKKKFWKFKKSNNKFNKYKKNF